MPWGRTVPPRILWQHSFQPISSARRVCGPGWHCPRCFSPQRSGCAAIRDRSDPHGHWIHLLAWGETNMNAAITTERVTEASPQIYGKNGGVLYLIIRSPLLPRTLGMWAVFGGVGWLSFLYPPLGYR